MDKENWERRRRDQRRLYAGGRRRKREVKTAVLIQLNLILSQHRPELFHWDFRGNEGTSSGNWTVHYQRISLVSVLFVVGCEWTNTSSTEDEREDIKDDYADGRRRKREMKTVVLIHLNLIHSQHRPELLHWDTRGNEWTKIGKWALKWRRPLLIYDEKEEWRDMLIHEILIFQYSS